MAGHPLRPATDRRLGRLLPHQLANPTRADPKAINLSPCGHIWYCSQFPGNIPNLRARSHVLLTRLPLPLRGVRLACVKPAASVRSEPESNSQVELTSDNPQRSEDREAPVKAYAFYVTGTDAHFETKPKPGLNL